MPADDDSLMFSMTQEMPSATNMVGGINVGMLVKYIRSDARVLLVKTDKKTTLNMSTHSAL